MFNQIKILYDLEKLVFNLNQENIDEIVESTMKLFDIQFPISFNVMLIRFVYSFFVSKMNIDPKLCIDYLLHIEKNEKAVINKSEKIIQIFSRYLSELETQESCFLLENLFEQKIIEPVIIKNLYNLYFAHYKDQNDIRVYKYLYLTFGKQFYSNIKELSKNDWELHKQLIKEGVNPKMIAKIIRNDEIEKLQGISSQPNFDFNQIIKKSLYERCSFVNTKNVSLIDYAAFFSAIKCFRYLLLNGANIENTMKFAIAGGSIEIIHLCEHNNLEIEKALTIAIKFHRNNIFHYLYEKSVNDIKDFDKLGIKCIRYDNYEIFLFLNEIGMKITLAIIKNAIEIGNIYFLNFIAKNQLPNLLIVSAETGNIEIVKLLLEQEEININIKDIKFFYLKFHLLI